MSEEVDSEQEAAGRIRHLQEMGYDTVLRQLSTLVPGEEWAAVLLAQKTLYDMCWYYQHQRREPAMTAQACGIVLSRVLEALIASDQPKECIVAVLTSLGVTDGNALGLHGKMLLAVNAAMPRSIVLAMRAAATKET